jgi:hypothetical protein
VDSWILALPYTDLNKVVRIDTVSRMDGMEVVAPKISFYLLTLSSLGVIRRQRCPVEMDRILILIGGIIYPGQRIVEINLHRIRRGNAVSDGYGVSSYFRALPDIVRVIAAENTKHQ